MKPKLSKRAAVFPRERLRQNQPKDIRIASGCSRIGEGMVPDRALDKPRTAAAVGFPGKDLDAGHVKGVDLKRVVVGGI